MGGGGDDNGEGMISWSLGDDDDKLVSLLCSMLGADTDRRWLEVPAEWITLERLLVDSSESSRAMMFECVDACARLQPLIMRTNKRVQKERRMDPMFDRHAMRIILC